MYEVGKIPELEQDPLLDPVLGNTVPQFPQTFEIC